MRLELNGIDFGNALTEKELIEVRSMFRKKNLDSAKKYLNESERKSKLEKRGIVADYLYYHLEMHFDRSIKKQNVR